MVDLLSLPTISRKRRDQHHPPGKRYADWVEYTRITRTRNLTPAQYSIWDENFHMKLTNSYIWQGQRYTVSIFFMDSGSGSRQVTKEQTLECINDMFTVKSKSVTSVFHKFLFLRLKACRARIPASSAAPRNTTTVTYSRICGTLNQLSEAVGHSLKQSFQCFNSF